MPMIPGEEFNFDIPYYTQKIGELSVLLEREQRKRMILYGAYMELKNKYEPEKPQQVESPVVPGAVLDINDSKPVEEVRYSEEPPAEKPVTNPSPAFGGRTTVRRKKR